jgi:hypothetical protein
MIKTLILGLLPLLILCGSVPALAQIKVAEELLVDLSAEDLDYGTGAATWINHGSLDDFAAMGTPVVEDVGGRKAVTFDGSSYFEGPASVPGIEGGGTRSIEVVAYNGPDFVAEETILSWSHRGGPDGTNIAFNYGSHDTWGAVGHWGSPDMAWSGEHAPAPAADNWWHLVYTYDGATVRLYVDGEENTTEDMTLNTHGGAPIRVAAQADGTGAGVEAPLSFTGSIAEVRIHDGVLSPADIMYNFAGPIQDPTPANGAENVADILLSWTYVDATPDTTYTVHFGANPDMMMPLPATDSELALGMVGSPLAPFDTTMYWKVVASDGVEGRLLSFQTEHDRPQFDRLEGAFQPQSIALAVGEEGSLSSNAVTFTGAEVSYQWFMVNPDGDDWPVDGATESTLTAVVELENDGDYYCVATSAAGSTASNAVMVDVQQGLIHRYTFNDGDVAEVGGVLMALDTVGGADGTIINDSGAAVVADGQLTLGNDGSQLSAGAGDGAANGDYVDLPNGLISSLGALTFEAWVTWEDDAMGAWQRAFSFGMSNEGEDRSGGASSVIYVTPRSGGGDLWAEFAPHTQNLNPGTGHAPLHQEISVTLVHDDLGGLDKLYVNGIAQAVKETNVLLSEIDDRNNWLGRSQWNDALLIGSYNEFRIHDTALSAEEVLANYLAGPDALGSVPEAEPCDENVVGDVNGDCVVDLNDAAVLIEQFLLDELFAD